MGDIHFYERKAQATMNPDTLKSVAAGVLTIVVAILLGLGSMALVEWKTYDSALMSLKTGKPLTEEEHRLVSLEGKARTSELERKLGMLERLSDAAEIATMTSYVLGELYSQWGYEAACLHHIDYSRVKDAAEALTASTEEARKRYGAYLQICVNDAARNSAVAAALAVIVDDVFYDVRGITDTLDTVLDVIGLLGVEDRWDELRAEILAAREYQKTELSKMAQPLIDGWVRDTFEHASPPVPATLI